MTKFAVLLLAAVAVQGLTTMDWPREQRQVQWMSSKLREVTTEAATAIEDAQVDNTQRRRSIMTQTNEFAHDIETVVYHMQRAAQNVQGEDRKTIQQIAAKLSECAYNVQQAMNAEPTQMKAQLKTQILKVAEEAEKLNQYFQQTQKPQEGQWDHVNEMRRAMMEIHAAIRKIKVHAEHQDKTMQEVFAKMQTVAGEMTMYTQNVKGDDEQTAEDLADFVQRLSQHMNNMVDKIQREADNQDGEDKRVMQEVANKMSEMRTKLEQAANTQGNTQQRVSQMKEQINVTMRDAATRMERLMQVAQQSKDQEGQGMKAVVKNMMMDVIAAGKTMQAQLKMMTEQQN